MPQKPKVLIVEDNPSYQNSYAMRLREKVKILRAMTLKEGERLFTRNPDIALVVMDACVPGENLNSIPLVRKIRETFHGPMLAASSDPYFCLDLMKAGCSHQVKKGSKYMVPNLVLRILGIQ